MKATALLATLVLGILVALLAAEAQQPTKVYRIGLLSTSSPQPWTLSLSGAFRQGLRDLGCTEGQNIIIEAGGEAMS